MLQKLEEQPNIDFWTDLAKPGFDTDIHIPREATDSIRLKLDTFGIKYSVMIEDLEKEVANEEKEIRASTFASNGFNYNTYNRLAAYHAEIRNLQGKHSNVASLFSAGTSYEGRDMLAVKISTGGSKPAIWVDGCIHAREWISCASVIFFLKQLLEPEPMFADKVTQVLSKYDFYVLPVFNVDGYEYTHTNNRMWRKTRSRGMYCRGADPNRNWGDSHWGGVGTSGNECSDIYHGKSAFSEIEVKQVANHLVNIAHTQGLKAYWNIHAYSQLVLHPWSYTTAPAKDDHEIHRIAQVFAAGIYEVNGKSFRPGQPSRILYSVAGGSMDYTYEKLGVMYSYAPEMRPAQGEFRNGFILPAKYIRPSGLEFTNGMLKAALAMK
jgi:carboxypeptidase A2